MPKCQFCDKAGILAPAEVHGPPMILKSGKLGLKLITCDFHLHHCAFFICADCWNAEHHLCKQTHPLWESRIVGWAPPSGAKEVGKREKWRFRYLSKDGKSYPTLCTRHGMGQVYCASCRQAADLGQADKPCTATGCFGVFRRGCCPACIKLDLSATDGVTDACTSTTQDKIPFDMGYTLSKFTTSNYTPDDLDPYLKLPIHYHDRKDYEILALGLFVQGAKHFCVADKIPKYSKGETGEESDEVEESDTVLDDSKWTRYFATDLKLTDKKSKLPIAGVYVLIPAAKFTGETLKNPWKNDVSSSSDGGRSTRQKRAKFQPKLNELQTAFGSPVLFRPKGCQVFSLSDDWLECLESDEENIKKISVLISLPPRSGGGSGGALGRGDGVGKSGVKHTLVSHHPKAADLTWSGYASFKKSAQAGPKGEEPAGMIHDFVAAPLAATTTYLPLRTLANSSLSLHITVPDTGRKAPTEDRALVLLKDRYENLKTRSLSRAADLLNKLIARIDDGTRGLDGLAYIRHLDHDSMREWRSNRAAQFEKNAQEAHALESEISSLVKQDNDYPKLRATLRRYLSLCRENPLESDGDDMLLQKANTAIVKSDTKGVLRDLEAVKKHLADADGYAAKRDLTLKSLSTEESALHVTLQQRLDTKGDPDGEDEELPMDDYVQWWGELWVPPGLDEKVWDSGAVPDLEPSAFEKRDNPKEVESENPSAWPETPDVKSEFWYWNGRPLAMGASTLKTWSLLTREKLNRREYKDSHLFVMQPPTKSRKDAERDQDTFFDSISATEVAAGFTNREVAVTFRFGSLAPEQNLKKPTASFEWSHLIGDGEGGGIHRSNVISSTRANNTEMLIIETVLQNLHPEASKAGLEIVIRVEATLATRLPELEKDETLHSGIRFTHYLSHVGDWMRYRVWLRKGKNFQEPKTKPDPAPKYPDSVLVLDHIMDCLRMRISKATVRLMEFQVRFLFTQAMQVHYGIAWGKSEAISFPLGWENGEGTLGPKAYVQSAKPALLSGNGLRLEAIPNPGKGDCLFYAVVDALALLKPEAFQAILVRIGRFLGPSAAELRQGSVKHLRRILGYPELTPFLGNMNQYGPTHDPRASSQEIVSFLTTYREDYNRRWPYHGYSDWDAYTAGMAVSGTWGDMLMCTVLSHWLGVQIEIHQAGNVVQPVLANDVHPVPVLRLYNPHGVHFEAMKEVPLIA